MSNNENQKIKIGKKAWIRGLIAFGIASVVLKPVIGIIGWIPLIGSLAKLAGTGAAAVIGLVVGALNVDYDVTTPRQQKKLERELEKINTSGDQAADEVITKGQEMIRQIREANAAIPDLELTRQLYQIESRCIQIFKTVSEHPGKASQVRKFQNYYLPITLKMLNNYRSMQEHGVSNTEMAEARDTLSRGLDMICTVSQKQLDSLYKDDMLDVTTDIDVLEQMLKRDGFSDTGSDRAPQVDMNRANARTAAAAQLGDEAHPTLNVDLDDMDIYPHYSNKKARNN